MRTKQSFRARIALRIFAISTGLLLIMSVSVYLLFDRALMANLDDSVVLRAEADLQLVKSDRSPPALAIVGDPGGERATGEVLLRLYALDGTMLTDGSPSLAISAEEAALVAAAATQHRSLLRTIDLDDDEDYRVFATPISDRGALVGILISGIERSRVQRPLAILRNLLLVADGMTALGLGLASARIAQRALRPVAAMTTTARRISHGNLAERVGGAESPDELGQLASTFNSMLTRLQLTIERERRFTADASHELRTPLAVIESSIDVTLSQPRDDQEYRNVLSVVQTQAKRLHRLADQLLLLARLEDDQFRQHFTRLDLTGLVEAAVEGALSRHTEMHVKLDIRDRPIDVLGNEELLARAIFNMLDNAAKYVGPSVSVEILIERQSNRVVIVIVDDGPGIPVPQAERIFERFQQGAVSRNSGGTGLGLAIVEAIVAAHSGSIRYVQQRARGAQFEIALPSLSPHSRTGSTC